MQFFISGEMRADLARPATSQTVGSGYSFVQSYGEFIPATDDIGNYCDDCTSEIELPFAVTLYGETFVTARASSNGALQFGSASDVYGNDCLPVESFSYAVLPHWDDLRTDGEGEGIFVATFGTAPNRAFVIEWRASYYNSPSRQANFEVVFYEGRTEFDIVYGLVGQAGFGATIGVIRDSEGFSQFSCDEEVLFAGLKISVSGNLPPNATADAIALPVNSSVVSIDVLANDSDPDGDSLTVISVSQPARGNTVVPPGGAMVHYVPNPEFIGSDSFTYTISDGRGGSAIATVAVTIVNHDPTAQDDFVTLDEDESAIVDVLANDTFAPDFAETLTIIAVGPATHGIVSFTATSLTYTPGQDYFGHDAFTYTISDGHGGTASAVVRVTVLSVNDLPQLSVVPSSVNLQEGETFTVSGSVADVDGDEHVVTIDWRDGSPATVLTLAAGVANFSASHTYADDQLPSVGGTPPAIIVTVSDGNGGMAQQSLPLVIQNVAPAIESLTGPTAPVLVGTDATLTVDFNDAGAADTHVVRICWGDGSADTILTSGGYSRMATHTFSSAGVYAIRVTVIDDEGAAATDAFELVVYDPASGFVTGAGFFESPLGALLSDPGASGRVQFTLLAKYDKTGGVPTGHTDIDLKFANFRFKSSAYEWLVVSGPKAQYSGSGMVNGAGNFGFILTLVDGTLRHEPDRLHLKIWDKTTGNVVYDNGPRSIRKSQPRPLAKGKITIHKAR